MKKNLTLRVSAIAAVLILLGLGLREMYLNASRNVGGQYKSGNPSSAYSSNATIDNNPVGAPGETDNTGNEERITAVVPTAKYHHSRAGGARPEANDEVLGASVVNEYQGNIPEPAVAKTPVTVAPADQPYVYHDYERRQSILHFAPEIGINTFGMYSNHTANLMANGFHVGVMMDMHFNDHLALQPGLMFISKGNQSKSLYATSSADVNNTETINLQYLELPVNLVYKFGDVGTCRFIAGGGPYIAYLLSKQDNMGTSATTYTGSPSRDAVLPGQPEQTVGMRQLDYGLGAFIGCETPGGLYIKTGGEAGFRNLQASTGNGVYANRNYGFMLSIGYLISYNRQ